MCTFPIHIPAIKVSQPLGDFWAFSIEAGLLRTVAFLDPTRISKVNKTSFLYSLIGSQREASIPRVKKIAKYIDTVEAAFPNSIILAANYINYGDIQLDEKKRWKVEKHGSGWQLVIPTPEKMASIIDGQHRLLGFDFAKPERREMQLLCSVYMDLPQAFQAYLFATININQRKVDKSLAYEQFGYNLEEEDPRSWAPDKTAVFLTRRLNLAEDSPFYLRVKIAPLDADLVIPPMDIQDWMVSTACVVEGIISLISSNPNEDRDLLHQLALGKRSRKTLKSDKAPLRALYLNSDDEQIYKFLKHYFDLCKAKLWSRAQPDSYITKTIGIQAQFEILRALSPNPTPPKDLLTKATGVLEKAKNVNFSDLFFQASGKGRVRVKNTLLFVGDVIDEGALPEADRADYIRIRTQATRT